MVVYVHVISVGTSVLSNFEREFPDEARKLGVVGWGSLSPDDPRQWRALTNAYRGSKVFKVLLNYLSQNPKVRSAELNAFLSFVNYVGHSKKDVRVLTYTTDTGNGFLCGRLIHAYLINEGYKTLTKKPVKIKGLGRTLQSFEDGLMNLTDKVVVKIRKYVMKGYKVYINATGGFKPETAYLILAGALAGAHKAYYIHETFKEIVELPLPKLSIDEKLVKVIKNLKQPYELINEEELNEKLISEGLDLNDLRERGIIHKEKPKFRKYVVKLTTIV